MKRVVHVAQAFLPVSHRALLPSGMEWGIPNPEFRIQNTPAGLPAAAKSGCPTKRHDLKAVG